MVRVLLKFSKDIVDQPITSKIILEKGIPINILSANINQLGGEILADIPPSQAEDVIKAFRDKGVTVELRKLIEKDDEKCNDCGACFSLCPVDAITIDRDFSILLDEASCIGATCGLCVDTCPRRAIKLIS